MASHAEHILDQAIAWHIGLEEAGADAWRDFVAWLEADPAHQAAYDQVALDDADLAAPVELEPAVLRKRRVWPQRVVWGGSAITAVAAALLALMPATMSSDGHYSLETKPGVRRVVALADGTKIEMNGGTRLTLDRHDTRVATLDRGEVMLDVVHHADRPFELRSGGVVLQDVGTRFNVARRGPALDVAVAEGSVLYQPQGQAVPLTRGMKLAMREGDDDVMVSHVAAETVGGWQHGQLDFRAVPLGTVAEDVARSTGSPIRVAEALAVRPFTGTLRVDRAPDDVVRSLAALVGGSSRRDGPGWVIEPMSASAR